MMKHAKELSGMAAALALLAGGAAAQGGGAVAGARPQQVLIAKDSAGRTLYFRGTSPLIDSLIKRLNNLPVGSADFLATDSVLQAALRAIPRPTQVDGAGVVGEYHITFTAPRAFGGSPMDVVPRGTLGFTADAVNRVWYAPTGQYLQYFEYPTIVAIETNSPASRAGVRSGDSLLAYNGLDLRGNAINLTQLLTPGRDVSVRLRRDGDDRDVVVSVERAPDRLMAERRSDAARFMASTPPSAQERRMFEEQVAVAARATTVPSGERERPTAPARAPVAAGGMGRGDAVRAVGVPQFASASPNGMLGAAMTDVGPGLATAIRGMEGKRGVLVTVVPEGSFAYRTGLRPGDVILKAESAEVETVAQLRVRLYLADQTSEKVRLTILRAGKTQEITYAPR